MAVALGTVLYAPQSGLIPEEIPALSAGRDSLEVVGASCTSRNPCYAESRFRNLVSKGILISSVFYSDSERTSTTRVPGKSGDEREN